MAENVSAVKWHTAKWGAWGWAETVAKLVALVLGLWAGKVSFLAPWVTLGFDLRLVAAVLLAFASVGAVVQLTLRIKQKETISFVFAVVNLLGHAGLLWALVHGEFPALLAALFGGFYVVGQAIKVGFLRATGYTEEGADSAAIQRFTVIQGLVYLLFTVLVFL